MNGTRPQPPLPLVYFALIVSILIYAFIVSLLSRTWPPPGPFEPVLRQPVILILMVLSLAMFVFSFSLGAWTNLEPMRRQWHRYIVRWAIIESVVIYALVATFITHDWRFFAIGWVLSLIGFALAPPPGREA